MKKLPVILATAATCVALYGCGQEFAPSTGGNTPAMESVHASSKEFGDYVLHFNSLSTDQLHPDIARAYDIDRSEDRVLLTVVITKKSAAVEGTSVPGKVIAKAHNLVGQPKLMDVRQVQDGGVYYYIGDVSISDDETLIFDVNATPEGEASGFAVRFSRRFAAN